MKSITEFPQTLIKTLSSTAFYKEAQKVKFSQALKYFLILTLLLAIAKASLVTITIVPTLQELSTRISQNILNLFPSDLAVTVTNGEVSTNVKEPYAVPVTIIDKIFPPSKSDLQDQSATPPANLVVIDTKGKSDDFPKYKTALLVIKSGLVMADSQTSGFRVYPFPSDTNVTVDRRFVRSLWSQFSPKLKWVIPATVAVVWIAAIIWYPSWYLTYLLFGALLLEILLKLGKAQIPYKTLYKVGLYSITLPIIAIFILDLFSFPIPFLFTSLFLGFSYFMLKKPVKN